VKSAHILVTEDSGELARIWRMLFRTKTDYIMRFCSSGQTALEAIEGGFIPDILITDYFLGDITGEQLIAKVRKLSPETSYIVATGNSDNDELQRLAAEKHIALFIKPVKFQDLKNKIEILLQEKRKIDLESANAPIASVYVGDSFSRIASS
jgi:DNA-binding NtrC family response regulator